MNGAPGGRQQCGAAPSQGAALPTSSLRSNAQQPAVAATANIFTQPDDGPPNGQVGHIMPPSQGLSSLSGSGTQQSAVASRDSSAASFPILQSSALQPTGGWPSQIDLQSLYSSQLQSAQSAVLRYGQSASSQPPVCSSELAMAASPHCSLSSASPATASASALTGIAISPGSMTALATAPSPSSAALQMYATPTGSLNPAILAQYQILLAAAQQQQAAAAAALAAASAGHQSPLSSRISSSPVSNVPLEQNIQRLLLHFQQQQQQLAAAAVASSQLVPSSAIHTASPLSAQMRAALVAANAFPQPASSLAAAVAQTRSTSSMASSSSTMTTSPTAGSTAVGTRAAPESAATLHSPFARVPPRHSAAAAAATGSLAQSPSTSVGALSSGTAIHSRHGQHRSSLMPPPPVPRSRHTSLSSPSTSQLRQRPSALPYQRPSPSSEVPFEMGTLPSQPYYPSHFMRGTVIRLQSGQLKRVEEMSTNDFVLSAALKSDLSLCNSTVVRIQEADKDRHVLVTFAVGEQKIQVSIEAGIEHPYFVVGEGWASCSPEKTRNSYGLICKQLAIGDVCITIRHTEKGEEETSEEATLVAGTSALPSRYEQAGNERAQRSSPRFTYSGREDRNYGWRSAPAQGASSDNDGAAPLSGPQIFSRQRRKSAS